METLVWRLFHDEKEVRVLGGASLTRGCRCNREHILSVLSRFPVDEQTNMADADGMIRVDCAFCSISHPISVEELSAAA
jgi:molecular chaperone Hsp33